MLSRQPSSGINPIGLPEFERELMTSMTHATGAPVADNQNIQTAGSRGPALLQDIWLLEKLAHFDREVIPERRMHAKGSGAFGQFTVTQDITRFTRARLFAQIGKQTPVFVRFSTVAGERGAADAERDIRGFAVKFYTEEGNWDLVGNNTPVFFMREPLRFPDLNHAVKRDPKTNLRSAQNNWDFWTLVPEALHQVTYLMGDRGLPASYRHMHGFGSHTFSFIDGERRRHWVKFTLKTQQGIRNLTDAEAAVLVAQDRESSQRDLFSAIERGEFPRWTLFVQIMSEQQAVASRFNPFDLSKVWPRTQFPLIEVGVLELHRNPDNYFADVEQAAFSPANVVPGISFSPDRMLQARLFSYGDTQRYRLGVNFNQIPVNAPRCPAHSYHRDGAMRVDANQGGTIGYEPNSRGEWQDQPQLSDPPLPLDGAATHWDHRVDDDNHSQAGALFRLMSAGEQQRLFDNTARSMGDATTAIKQRHIENCTRADPAYGAGVRKALDIAAHSSSSR
jgi:catalase